MTLLLSMCIVGLTLASRLPADAQTAATLVNLALGNVDRDSAVLVVETQGASIVTVQYGPSVGNYTSSASETIDHPTRHEFSLSGLASLDTVFYRVSVSDAADPQNPTVYDSGNLHFRPARDNGEPIRYGVFGDTQSDASCVEPAPPAAGTIVGQMAGEDLDLALLAGDSIVSFNHDADFCLSNDGHVVACKDDSLALVKSRYGALFSTMMGITPGSPLYMAVGNHEQVSYQDASGKRNAKDAFEQEHTLPANQSADGYREEYYSFDNGDTHFVVLCTDCPQTADNRGQVIGEQLTWLQQDLANTRKPWKVVMLHRPVYIFNTNNVNVSDVVNQQDLHNIFEANHVNVVFQGHAHQYQHRVEGTTFPVHYIVTGSTGENTFAEYYWRCVSDECKPEHVIVDETKNSMTINVKQLDILPTLFQQGGQPYQRCDDRRYFDVQDNNVIEDTFSLTKSLQNQTIAIDATGGSCSVIGTWDQTSKTCTLKDNVFFGAVTGIEITANDVTIDGNGYRLIGNGDYGAHLKGVLAISRQNITVKNLGVEGFWLGLQPKFSSYSAFTGNTVTGNDYGIWLDESDRNAVSDNTVKDNNHVGIGSWGAESNRITGNTIAASSASGHVDGGLHLYGLAGNPSSSNEVYGNAFIENPIQAEVHNEASGNIFNRPAMEGGGNFWSNSTSPDNNSDGFVDNPFAFSGGQDNYPLVVKPGTDAAMPEVSSVQPGGVIHTDAAGITASYADPGAAPSGIDADSVNVRLDDGESLTGCSATGISVSCPATGLSVGQHSISGSVSDNAGNTAPINGSFEVARTSQAVTIDAAGGSCSAIGTWNQASGTCTLTENVYVGGVNGIEIAANGVTVDGNGYRLIGDGNYGSHLRGVAAVGRQNITVKNLGIEGFWLGLQPQTTTGSTFTGNKVTANDYGIWLDDADSNAVSDNTVTDNNFVGIGSWGAVGNTITGNMISASSASRHVNGGLHLYGMEDGTNSSNGNAVYGNSFVDNPIQAEVHFEATGNVFHGPASEGGNYWSNGDPGDKVAPYGFEDSPVTFSGGIDDQPLKFMPGTTIIRSNPVTIDANGGNCSDVGQWNQQSHTCTLTSNVYSGPANGFEITASGVILDGAKHRVIGNSDYPAHARGVLASTPGSNITVTVRNLGVEGYWLGIQPKNSTNSTLSGNSVTANDIGIWLDYSVGGNSVSDNMVWDNNLTGIGGWSAAGNTIQSNNIWATSPARHINGGLHLYGNAGSASNNNRIYGNRFLDNPVQAEVHTGATGNAFTGNPYGIAYGNYWSNWHSPDLLSLFGFVDNTYSFNGGEDSLPWVFIGDSSSFDSENIPDLMVGGASAQVAVTFTNSGTNTWTSGGGYSLVPAEGADHWGVSAVGLDPADSIAPGEQKTFTFDITAPAGSLHRYDFQWQMAKNGQTFGPASPSAPISLGSSLAYPSDPDKLTAFEVESGYWRYTLPGGKLTVSDSAGDKTAVSYGLANVISGANVTVQMDATSSSTAAGSIAGIEFDRAEGAEGPNQHLGVHLEAGNVTLHRMNLSDTSSSTSIDGSNVTFVRGTTAHHVKMVKEGTRIRIWVDDLLYIDDDRPENSTYASNGRIAPLCKGTGCTFDGIKARTDQPTAAYTLTQLMANPHPGTTVDLMTMLAKINGTIYCSSFRTEDNATSENGYDYKLTDGVTTELNALSGQAEFAHAYDAVNGKIYQAGQLYDTNTPANSTHMRNVLTVWDVGTDTFQNIKFDFEGDPLRNLPPMKTDNNNEFIAMLDDGDNLILSETAPPYDADPYSDGNFKYGAGLWRIPKASIGDPSTYERFYEWGPGLYEDGAYLTHLRKINGTYYATLGLQPNVYSSSNLTDWEPIFTTDNLDWAPSLLTDPQGNLVMLRLRGVKSQAPYSGRLHITTWNGSGWSDVVTDISFFFDGMDAVKTMAAYDDEGQLIVFRQDLAGSKHIHMWRVDPATGHADEIATMTGNYFNEEHPLITEANTVYFATHSLGGIWKVERTP